MSAPGVIRIVGWSQPLRQLLYTLTQRLAEGDATAVRVELARGASVTLSRDPDGRRRVEIGRQAKPVTRNGYTAWELECSTFAHQLGMKGWARTELTPHEGLAVAFVERESTT
jgi:hypothetical protein